MQQLTVKLISNGPLLLNSDRLANPLAPETKAHKKMTGDVKLKATDEGQLMIAHSEYMAAFYKGEMEGIIIPTLNIRKSLIMGARGWKAGKKVEGGIVFLNEHAMFNFDGPKDPQELWDSGEFVDVRSVVISNRRVMKYRPMLREWWLETDIIYDPSMINKEELLTWWEQAGRICRIGDFRSVFGRYTVELPS